MTFQGIYEVRKDLPLWRWSKIDQLCIFLARWWFFWEKSVALFSTLKMKNCQKKIGTYTTHTRMQIRDRGGICAPPPALNRVNRSGDLWNFSTFDIRVALYVKYNWEEKWEIKNSKITRMTQLCFHIQFIFHSKFSKHFFGFISSK